MRASHGERSPNQRHAVELEKCHRPDSVTTLLRTRGSTGAANPSVLRALVAGSLGLEEQLALLAG